MKAEFERRTNSALWFVSNCNAALRMKVAAELGQIYPLTVLGSCSQVMRNKYPTVSTSKITFNEMACSRHSSCELNAFSTAKFYLSFENSNCSDYITEKFWKSLNNDLIPVVMQPNREYYERMAPKDSFIHLADFDYDIARLAIHLNNVASDFSLYRGYFEWKHHLHAAYDTKTLEQFRICELCARLNNQHLFYNSYYKRVSNFIESACYRS